MDKSKNRTDLLAAGKKKLQQYRQKKDSKGGKSSKKSSKTRHYDYDADAATSAFTSTTSSQVTDEKVETEIDSNLDITESSEPQSFEESRTPHFNAPSSDAITYDMVAKSKPASNIELPVQVQGVGDHDTELPVRNEGESAHNDDADVAKEVPVRISNSLGSEGGSTYDGMSAPVDTSLTSKDIPLTSLMQTTEDQEADSLDMKKSLQSCDTEIDGQKKIPLSELDESAQSLLGTALEETKTEKASLEAEQIERAVELSSSIEEIVPDRFSASALSFGQEDDTAIAGPVMINQERETVPGSRDDEMLLQSTHEPSSKEAEHSGEKSGLLERLDQHCASGGSGFVHDYHDSSMATHELNSARPLDVSPSSDVGSVSLLQLTEVISRLSEEEFNILLQARRAVLKADPAVNSLILPDPGFSEIFEKLKEELFLVNFMKDVFNMQLAEQVEYDNQHYQLIDELSDLRVSHNIVHVENQHLAKELANCRAELHDVASRSEEVENGFNIAKAEVETLSAGVLELQNSIEVSPNDSSHLSRELADCRAFVIDLQAENKDLKETLALMNEEKIKLVEEKEFHLGESRRLLTELSDFMNIVDGLKAENSKLIENVSLVTEEKNKIEVEIQHLSLEVDRLSKEWIESKHLVESLQVDNANLNGSLKLSVDQMKTLEEEKQSVSLENERLSSEVIALQEQLSVQEGERMRFEVDLKEATMHVQQLAEENIFLKSTLDVHKAKIEEIGTEHSQVLSQYGDLRDEARGGGEQSENRENASTELHIPRKQDKKETSGGASLNLLEHEIFDESLGFVFLNVGLDEMEKDFEKLQKAIDGLFSHSVSSGKSGGRVSSPGISKLIEAFESKTSQDDNEAEKKDYVEVQSPSDPLKSTKEQFENLRQLITKWRLEVQNAGELFMGERDGRKFCDAKYSELKVQYEGLKQYCSDLEASNIELAVQYEAVKQFAGDIQEKKSDLEELCEALKREDIRLKAKNNELYEKLGNCQSKINELHTGIYVVRRSSDELTSIFCSQLEDLQKEVTERAMLLEQGWNTSIADIVEAVGKLDESVGKTSSSTLSIGTHDASDIKQRLEFSLNAATEVIVDLQKRLEATYSDHEAICASYKVVNEKCDDLLGKNELAVGILQKIYGDIRKLVLHQSGSLEKEKVDLKGDQLPDLLNYSSYQTLLNYMEDVMNEKLELESITKELKSELMHREKELDELNTRCGGLDAVSRLIEDVEGVLKVEDTKIKMNTAPLLYLESLVSSLVQKTREADIQLHIANESYESKVMDLPELQEKMHHLDIMCFEHENETLVLKESLRQAEEALQASCSQLNEKTSELKQSEQRVASIREKLSMAVAKGKGLVVQRDGLKQSLTETSSELERCLQELQLKNSELQEVDMKLKTYAEAGERVEALESELSYIRNSANALRESFLLKDSVLQRIEEILEDLDLPEQFHSRDIIEKIDWLARSAAANSLPMNDWDQKSSAGGGSYSDAGFVVMDGWKDDGQLHSDSGDDLRKKFEELQSKYYGLAEQNEMLEQSLMERNSLVQRWEDLVDRIEMPSHLRSMETEDRIEWLGRALFEANHHIDSLQLKIEKYDSYCGLLNADLEESRRRVSALQADLRAVSSEREHLSERVEVLMHERGKLSVQTRHAELENEKLHNEITGLSSEREHLSERVEVLMHECEKLSVQTKQAELENEKAELENEKLHNEISGLEEKLVAKVAIKEQILIIEGKIRRLQGIVGDVLQEPIASNPVSGTESIDYLEVLLSKLIENYAQKAAYVSAPDGHHIQEDDTPLHEARSINMLHKDEQAIDDLKKDLEEALCELTHVKEERDKNLEKQLSLSGEVEALTKKTEQLQELLNQEEQKSASVREKLNVAVRKGKSLVQQRDGLKQTIEEMTNEIERLKSQINNKEHTLADYAQKFRDLLAYKDRFEAVESENLLLKDRVAETEHYMQEQERTLKMILEKLDQINIDGEGNTSDPIKKLEWFGKLCSDLHAAVASLQQELTKSKRASELLLAELNEVQERNDTFQEEVANLASELVDVRKEKDSAEVAKLEAISHLEKLAALHAEERKNQFFEIMGLKSRMNQFQIGFWEVVKLLGNALFKDLESYRNLEAGLQSCMKSNDVANLVDTSVIRGYDGILPMSSDDKISVDSGSDLDRIDHFDDDTIAEICLHLGHQLQEFLMHVGSLKEGIHTHLNLAQEQDKTLSKLLVNIQREMTSLRESCEANKKEIIEKDGELIVLRGNVASLYEACTNSVIVIENGKMELAGKNVVSADPGINLTATSPDDGRLPFNGQVQLISGENVRTLADKLLLAAKEFVNIKTEFLDAKQKEMKATITNLQREVHEKDVQRDRICTELVNQIKDAEAAMKSNSQDLQSSRIREHNLERQLEEIEAERKVLKERVDELQHRQVTAAELEEKVRSQTDLLAAKDQEIESLMHALDEEEMQMEEAARKIEELEKVVHQKNLDLENLEASRAKVTKKLSITVNKFDELHHLSGSLLSEVEKLQSQLQERDTEISFLRQEVTRCTNDVLLASQISNKGSSDEIFEFVMSVDTMLSREGMHDVHPDVKSNSQVHEYKEILHQKLVSILSELEDLRAVAESKDALLQVERSKVDEFTRKVETLEMSLREKESRLNLLEGVEESGRGVSASSEILEVEPVVNKWTATGSSVMPQVRSLRKGNNDHVAIAVDMDTSSTSRIEDEDDDKVHGFKSLTSSKIVPRFTRPVTDMIDGLWVSCDRTLMRQPSLRLGIIIYWAIMHALLAFFVV